MHIILVVHLISVSFRQFSPGGILKNRGGGWSFILHQEKSIFDSKTNFLQGGVGLFPASL